ncbi:MAG: hypothetical protein HZA50_03365 [Planctomycetes bacterium]|nr:hypothetical protein [Planctomycetota bacterium]
MDTLTFEQAVEKATGVSIDTLRNTPIEVRRAEVERAKGSKTSYRSYYPLVGRGSVLRDRVVDHDKIEKEFLKAIHE